MRKITIYTTSGNKDTENGCWVDETVEVREEVINVDELLDATTCNVDDIAEITADEIRRAGCDIEYSSYPDWQPHGWYAAEPWTDLMNGLDGEKSAHLDGFSEDESRAIHGLITGRA